MQVVTDNGSNYVLVGRVELRFFVWEGGGGGNFGTNILVLSQDNSSHTCGNAHTRI